MTPAEAQKLLTVASGFDNRDTTSEAAPRAWAAALADIPADVDAFAAVHRFYGQPDAPGTPTAGRRWIEPHHVRTIRRAIRADRLGPTIPAYEPPRPDETGSEFVRRRRAQLAAIGDGDLQPTPVLQLTGGPATNVAAQLAGIGRQIPAQPPEGWREEAGLRARPPELAVACPYCHAAPSEHCTRGRDRHRMRDTHPSRKDAHSAAQETA
jgi:hypothetical protein